MDFINLLRSSRILMRLVANYIDAIVKTFNHIIHEIINLGLTF